MDIFLKEVNVYPKYVFDCGCTRTDYIRPYAVNGKKYFYRFTCPDHPGAFLVSKIIRCKECGHVFPRPPRGNNTCPECADNSRNVNNAGVLSVYDKPDHTPVLDIRDYSKNPCLVCERLHEDKNNDVCMHCQHRLAYLQYA